MVFCFLVFSLFISIIFFDSLRALHFVARHGHVECMATLLELGADVTAEDFYGWQAIHEATLNGHAECLALLLEHGAKVDAAAYNNNGPNTPLHYAARHGHVRCVELLLTHGADWKCSNKYGETPLHCTAMRGHVDCMLALVQAGMYCLHILHLLRMCQLVHSPPFMH